MKAYLVKYCLNSGIKEIEGEIRNGNFKADGYVFSFNIKKDIAFSKDEAIEKAEAIRAKRIVSLKKQIERLEKLKF